MNSPRGEISKHREKQSGHISGDMLNAPPHKLSIRHFFMQGSAWGLGRVAETKNAKSEIKSLNK